LLKISTKTIFGDLSYNDVSQESDLVWIASINENRTVVENCRVNSSITQNRTYKNQDEIDMYLLREVLLKQQYEVWQHQGILIEKIAFSRSRSNGWVAVATTQSPAIGIDIEWTQSFGSDNATLAAEILTEEESIKYKLLLDSRSKTNFLHKIWTKKEAYQKWLGNGLNVPIRQIQIEEDLIFFESHTIEWGASWIKG
jgi:hypothetical protein